MPGYYQIIERIKSTATPIDNVTKFAWYDDDFETVEEWHEYTPEELADIERSEQEEELKQRLETLPDDFSDLEDAIAELGEITNDNSISNEDLMDAITELGALVSELMSGGNNG